MIASARQEGSHVRVVDSHNSTLCIINGELIGFTSTTVTVKQGGRIRVCDEHGNTISLS